MKKLACVCVVLALSVALFSEDAELDKGSKNIGGSIGLRGSILGLEPTASFIFYNMELEASVPLSASGGGFSKEDKTKFGYMPGGSFGYLQNAFGTGWQNGVGLDYHWISPSWWDATFLGSLMTKASVTANFHVFSLYYKGGWRWNNGCNLYFRLLFPIVLFGPSSDGSVGSISIINKAGLAASFLTVIITPSIGFRWSF